MAQVAQVAQTGLGNTITKPGKGRKWCFTLNNYTNDEYNNILAWIKAKNWKYCIGKEIGKDNKIPHLQGYIQCGNAISFNTIKKMMPRAHIEKAHGTMAQNFTYCSKDGTFEKSLSFQEKLDISIMETEYKDITWHDWQVDILAILETTPDNRSINWFWDSTGNIGKSFLTKYIDMKHDIIIADGKKDNIFNQIKIHMELQKIPRIIILDVPRHNIEYVNYGILEQIKNGLIYSGKYEGGKCRFPHPHIIIFANSPPIEEKLSLDRWNIKDITPIETVSTNETWIDLQQWPP